MVSRTVVGGMVDETPVGLSRRLRLTRVFRSNFALAPSTFRRRGIIRIELAARCGVHYRPDGATEFTPIKLGAEAMNVEIVDLASRRVAALAHLGPYNQIGDAFMRLGAVAGPAGLLHQPTPPEMVAIYHDDPESTPADTLRADAGIVVGSDAKLPPGLHEVTIIAGRYARTTHHGSYELLGDAWARFLGGWLPESGHRIGAGGSFEIYRNTPMDTPADQLLTDLYIAVE